VKRTTEHPELTINFEIGKRQNVRANYVDQYGELVREVTNTKWHKEEDGLWFSWYWKPEQGRDLVGSMDCGFAGMRILENDGTPTKHHEHFIKS
jgi:hypothetical protein